MVIDEQNYLNAGVYVVRVKDEGCFWVKMLDVRKKLGAKNMCQLVKQEIMGIVSTNKLSSEDVKRYKRSLRELKCKAANNSKDKYVCNDIVEKIIKNCGVVKKCNDGKNRNEKERQRQNFKVLLGFNKNDIFLTKEQSMLSKITTVFVRCEIYLQYSVLDYRVDTYFPKYRLVVEIDE